MALAGFSAARGRGAAAGDEPQALRRRRSTSTTSSFVAGAVGATGVAPEIGRAGLGADPGLLRLRLPEGALGRLRPARLPVGLAAGPLRPRVPLRAAERAADGLLPARLAGPRGAAARHPDRPARRQPQRASSATSSAEPELRGGLVVRIGLGYVKGVRKEEMEALVAERERGGPYRGIADLASRSGAGAGEPRTAGLGGGARRHPGRRRRRAPRGRSGGSGSPAPGAAARRAAPSWRCRSSRPRPPRAGAARRVGAS